MMLNECGSVITDDLEVADTFNNYFTYISKTLDIPTWINWPFIYEQDPISYAVLKYMSHPRILSIKRSSPSLEKFNFSYVLPEIIYKHIISLKKAVFMYL